MAERCLRRAYRIGSHDPARTDSRTPFGDRTCLLPRPCIHAPHFQCACNCDESRNHSRVRAYLAMATPPVLSGHNRNLIRGCHGCRRGRSRYRSRYSRTPTISKSLRVGYKGPSTVLYGCTLSVKLTEDRSPTSSTSPSSSATRAP